MFRLRKISTNIQVENIVTSHWCGQDRNRRPLNTFVSLISFISIITRSHPRTPILFLSLFASPSRCTMRMKKKRDTTSNRKRKNETSYNPLRRRSVLHRILCRIIVRKMLHHDTESIRATLRSVTRKTDRNAGASQKEQASTNCIFLSLFFDIE